MSFSQKMPSENEKSQKMNNDLLHTLVCNKKFEVQSGDWIHAI